MNGRVMSRPSRVLIAWCASLALAGAAEPAVAATCSAVSGKINVRANIDGRSRLILQGNTVQWQHFDNAAPGREPATDQPTLVDCAEWFPTWPDIPDRRNDDCDGCVSSILTPDPPLPSLTGYLGIETVACRETCDVVDTPSDANGFKLVIEFDDNSAFSSADYELNVLVSVTTTTTTLPGCTEPACRLRAAVQNPPCGGVVPASVGRKIEKAASLFDQLGNASPAQARKLRKRLKPLLVGARKAAQRATRGKHPKLGTACAVAIGAAADQARAGLLSPTG